MGAIHQMKREKEEEGERLHLVRGGRRKGDWRFAQAPGFQTNRYLLVGLVAVESLAPLYLQYIDVRISIALVSGIIPALLFFSFALLCPLLPFFLQIL